MEGIVLRVVSALCEEPEPLVRGQMAHKRIEAERQNTAEEIAGIAEPSEQTSQQMKTILPSGPSHKKFGQKNGSQSGFLFMARRNDHQNGTVWPLFLWAYRFARKTVRRALIPRCSI